jgi:preprotein translocase subunit YajC
MLEFVILQAQQKGGSQWGSLILIGGMLVVMYFFMFRPQQKKAKEQKVFREGLKKGDNVVTIGGLHGKIASIETDDTVIVEVDKGIRLKFEKGSISAESSKRVQSSTGETK